MIEYATYVSGHWQATCPCGWTEVHDGPAAAYKAAHWHRKNCNPMGAPRANENAPTDPTKEH